MSELMTSVARLPANSWRILQRWSLGIKIAVNLLLAWSLYFVLANPISGPAATSDVAVLVTLQLVAACWLYQLHPFFGLSGPLLWYELARLARRGRTTVVRCVYGLFLLAWLFYMVDSRFPGYASWELELGQKSWMSVNDRAHLGHTFVVAIVAVQGVAVFALTPAYVALAIAEEKDRKSLEMLFSTPLSDREIVLGKLFGRLAHLGSILIVGLPILSLATLFGGVDVLVVLGGLAITGLALLSVGGISILCSVVAPNGFKAVVSSYTFVTLFGLICLALPWCSPITFMNQFDKVYEAMVLQWQSSATNFPRGVPAPILFPTKPVKPPAPRSPPPDPLPLLATMIAVGAFVHGLVFLFCTKSAVTALREASSPTRIRELPRPLRPALPFAITPLLDPVHSFAPILPPVDDNALLWKEVNLGSHWGEGDFARLDRLLEHWKSTLAMCLFCIGIFWGAYLIMPELGSFLASVFNLLIRVATVSVAGIGCVALGLRAAASVSRERDGRTLGGLLLLPVGRIEILVAKWQGCLLHWRLFGYGLVFLWLMGLATGVLHVLSVLLLIVSCSAFAMLLTSLGLWLSLVARNTRWAMISMALILLLMFGVSGFGPGAANGLNSVLQVGLSPLNAWWFGSFSWGEGADGLFGDNPRFRLDILGIGIGAILSSMAAILFWRLACWELDQEEA